MDPNGMWIDKSSKDEWNNRKQEIQDQLEQLKGLSNQIKASAKDAGWSDDRTATALGDLDQRISSLQGTIQNLNLLENSSQGYGLAKATGGEGGTFYDNQTGEVVFHIGNTANFVHETTHGGQFESGDIAFSGGGQPVLDDLTDEVAAYKAEYAYSPQDVSGLKSSSVASSFQTITPQWVQGLTLTDGSKPYAPGGSANTGITSININSNRDQIIAAYPDKAASFSNLPPSWTPKQVPSLIYKH
jgi:hypothetical protein